MARVGLKHKDRTIQYALRVVVFLCGAFLPLFSSQVVNAETNDVQNVISQNKIATDDNNSTSTIMPLAATTAADPTDIASGTFGTCDWNIDANGKLTITTPEGSASGILGVPNVVNGQPTGLPWYNYFNQIKSVYVGENIIASYSTSFMFSHMPNVTTIDVSNLNVQFTEDLGSMFTANPKLISITGLGNWNLSKANSMSSLFSADPLLSELKGIGNWNLSSVTDLSFMFSADKEIRNIDELKNWDTSNITNMQSLFQSTNIADFSPIENWDVSKVSGMNSMFAGNSSVMSIDLSRWRTPSLHDTSRTFSSCDNLAEIKGLDNWDMSNATSIAYMFYGDVKLLSLSGIKDWDTSEVQSMAGVFWICRSLVGLDLENWNTANVTDMSNMFNSASKLDEKNVFGIDKFDTNKVTKMNGMFSSTGYTVLDLSNFKTGRVTDMSYMFSNTHSLQRLIGNFDTSLVKNMEYLFNNSNISDLSKTNIENWDTANVDNLSYTFSGDINLKTILIGNWDVSKVTNFYNTFYNSSNLENLPISNWNVLNATTMRGMFWGTGIKTLDMSTWNTSNVDNFYAMFRSMPNLETLDISNFDTTNATDVSYMFDGDTSLWKLTLGPKSVLTNLNGPALEQTASVPTPVPGTAIKDDSTDKTYSAISDRWQVVDTASGGTDHAPLGDLVSAQDIMDKFSTVGNLVTTYVWQQQTKGDMKMTVPDIDFGTTSNASGLVRRKNDFAIDVTNNTYPTDAVPSDLYVSMDAPLTDETDKTKTLNDVLVFKDEYNNENVLSSANTKIFSGNIANGSNTISWDDDHGILLDMNNDRYAENGHYSTTLKWTLTNSL